MNRISSLILILVGLLSCGQDASRPSTAELDANISGIDTILIKGEQYLEAGQPEQTIRQLESIISSQSGELPTKKLAEAYYLLSRSYYDYEENELALEKINEAYRLFLRTKQNQKAIEALSLKGEMALYLNRYVLADSCFAQVVELASAENNTEAQFDALIKWSAPLLKRKLIPYNDLNKLLI